MWNQSLQVENSTTRVGTKKLAEGGEGEIFDTSLSNLVAKIYKTSLSQQQIDKLKWMVANKPEISHLAWPENLIFEGNKLVGFTMQKINGEFLSNISHPKKQQSSKSRHLGITNYLLISVCVQLAKLVNTLHRHQIIIGDLNGQNVFVASDGGVWILDCDSFQVNQWVCPVGQANYLAPEFHGKDLSQSSRTTDADNFSLAILLYEVLLYGQHPCNGVSIKGNRHEPKDRILHGEYLVTGKLKAASKLTPSPEWLPNALKQLFIESFTRSKLRPTGKEYASLIEQCTKKLFTVFDKIRNGIGHSPLEPGHRSALIDHDHNQRNTASTNNKKQSTKAKEKGKKKTGTANAQLHSGASAWYQTSQPVSNSANWLAAHVFKLQQVFFPTRKYQRRLVVAILLILTFFMYSNSTYNFYFFPQKNPNINPNTEQQPRINRIIENCEKDYLCQVNRVFDQPVKKED